MYILSHTYIAYIHILKNTYVSICVYICMYVAFILIVNVNWEKILTSAVYIINIFSIIMLKGF